MAIVTVHAQQPLALSILPAAPVAYSGIASTLTIAGGVPPYRAISSNPAVLPVASGARNDGRAAGGQRQRRHRGRRDRFRMPPDSAPRRRSPCARRRCSTRSRSRPAATTAAPSAICSGQNGTAVVTVLGAGGGALAGRQVRFDVLAGPYGIATPRSRAAGRHHADGHLGRGRQGERAHQGQRQRAHAVRAASGHRPHVGPAAHRQFPDPAGHRRRRRSSTVVPSTATITGAFKGECSSGVRVDYYIYGGTPPYRVTSTFPDAITLDQPRSSTRVAASSRRSPTARASIR